ncbi:hypothetical protein [Gymnodinialimonas sp. 57CJ19]|uniref:hypothetical protein n=1 Tax=Gymnodinialimonas sp. 57CJ19 TaxID=3138498 RepID=UPI0031345571
MLETTDYTAPQPVFPTMELTEVANTAKPAPTHGPYDWAADAYGADSFVFRAPAEVVVGQ